MTKKELFEKVKEMIFPLGDYAVFGSGILCAKGLRECSDIDIIMSEKLFQKMKKDRKWKLEIKDNGSKCLKNDKIEAFKEWYPGQWNCNLLIQNAEIIDGIPFVKKENVIKWKEIRNYEKDKIDLEL